jgi:predicted transcriptional regulator
VHLTVGDKPKLGSISIVDILRVLSDDKTRALFGMVAFTLSQNTGVVITKLGITKRQYYLRIFQLRDTGLVKRKNGMYFLTSLGKVVYEFHLLIEQAVENYWNLK